MIDAVIVNYHTETLVKELLAALLAEPLIKKIFLVDNSSTFEEPASGKLEILKPRKNLGFGRAVNLAAEKSRKPYLLVFNPDVRPLSGSIEALLETAEKTGAALVGPRFFWDEEKTFRLPPAEGLTLSWWLARKLASLSAFDRELLSFYWRLRHQRFWQAREPFWEPFLSGACLLIRKEAFKGPFDPRFFLYYEDTDLSLRAWKTGGGFCAPKAEMIHFWNQSPDPPEGKALLMQTSEKLFLEKYYGGGLKFLENTFSNLVEALPPSPPKKETVKVLWQEGKNTPPLIETKNRGRFLEIALNPWFVPFAQAELKGSAFYFPPKVWERMPPGKYFVRIIGFAEEVLGEASFLKDA